MTTSNEYYVLAFNSTHNAISTKKLLDSKIEYRTIPTLREISASCGISIRIESNRYNKLNTMISEKIIDKSHFLLYKVVANSQGKINKVIHID